MGKAASAPPAPDLGILLGLAYGSFVECLHAELAQRGFSDISAGFGYVFRSLADGPLSVTQLAERLGITTQGVTKLANDMQAAGYLVRKGDALDARVKRLELTERGRAALAAARRFHQQFERQLMAASGERNLAVLRSLLGRIVESHAGAPAERRTIRPF
jgi:DNA-binding MarR family transcriptional regulator